MTSPICCSGWCSGKRAAAGRVPATLGRTAAVGVALAGDRLTCGPRDLTAGALTCSAEDLAAARHGFVAEGIANVQVYLAPNTPAGPAPRPRVDEHEMNMRRGNLQPMDATDYEYRGLKATTWDLLRGDTSHWGDRAAFRAVITRYGEPVLDVGCATGRLLLDYLAEGIDIDGVDLSPEMLALCRAKAAARGLTPTLYQQAMETLDLPRRYRTILAPSSTFQLITDDAAARAAMRHFYDHLLPGGALAMPFMVLWRGGDPTATDWSAPRERIRPEDGAVVRHWSRAWYDPAARLEHTEDRYEVVRDGAVLATETIRRSPATRWYTHDEVRALYRAAGFVDVRLTREWSDAPAAPDDRIATAVGTRP